MATYNSIQVNERYPVSGVGMGGRTPHGERGEVTITAALTTADVGTLFYLPPRFRVTGGYAKATDMDTNGSPTLVLKVGDAGDDDRYFSGLTIGQTGAYSDVLANTGIDYKTTARTPVTWGVSTNAATGVAGTFIVQLFGTVEEPD